MRSRRGQSILEYTIIIGIVTVVLYYMGTGVKRGVQSLVKVTADQVGNQANSDQDFNDSQQGFMASSNSMVNEISNKFVNAIGYIPAGATGQDYNDEVYTQNTSFNEITTTNETTVTNGGFTQSN